jgi:NTP pyrophosphatase (non-canonical NTP hydrolase)
MNLKDITTQSIEAKKAYASFEKNKYGREWNEEEIYTGLVSDIGDLGRLVLAKGGVEMIPDLEDKLKHELGECLWGIAVLAGKYNIENKISE